MSAPIATATITVRMNRFLEWIAARRHLIREAATEWVRSGVGQSRGWMLLGLLFSAVFLWVSFQGVDIEAVGKAMVASDPWWVFLAALANMANLWLRAVRWRLLLGPIRSLPCGDVFSATMIGFATNNVLPARTGELFKVYVLGEKHEMRKSSVLATVVAERLFDVTALLALTLVGLVGGFSVGADWMGAAADSATIIVVGMVVLLIAIRRWGKRIAALWKSKLGRVRLISHERWANALMAFVDGLEWMTRKEMGRIVPPVVLVSILIWLCMLVNVYWALVAFQFPLSLTAAVLLLVGQSFGMLVPSGPAQLGTYQFITVALLGLLGVSQTDALGLSLVLHATRFFPTTVIGLCYLIGWFCYRPRAQDSGNAIENR